MNRSVAKISLVLLVIVTLPLSFYLVREFSALTKNEAMIERVFSKQLESILYSVNQYSENVVHQWGQSLDLPVDPQSELMKELVDNLFQNNQSIMAIRFLNLDEHNVDAFYLNRDSARIDVWPDSQKIVVLQEYLKENYQQFARQQLDENQLLLYFLPRNKNGKEVCQILVDPKVFVTQNLSPQVQQISQNLFYINVADSLTNTSIFSTDKGADPGGKLETAAMWYLPHYQIGIRLKTKSLEDLASERTQRDNFMLLGLTLVVLMGLLFVIYNIRKEMKLAELKSEFVSNVSHEIRTPLSLISMYSETLLLKRVNTAEKQQEYLKTIHLESARLTDIVNRILNFSRLEKNRIKYRFERIELTVLIPEVIDSLRSYLDASVVECHFSANTRNVNIYADSGVVKTMLVNLIDNAIKYGADAGKKINIRVVKKPKQVWIEVEDNGIGIAAKSQKHIFDQFYRVTDGDLAHKAKGSGLGLNLVKRMMKAHGGTVTVHSKLGEGSTFTLKFPEKKQGHV